MLGITPEGINQNYVMYEFALERGWDQTSTNIEKWVEQYTLARYGQENDFIKKAWHLLRVSENDITLLILVTLIINTMKHFVVEISLFI